MSELRRGLRLAAGAALAAPAAGYAHLVTTGLGPVYDGASHLFVSLEDLLAAVALALVAGLNGPAAGRRALFVVPAAWLAAGGAGYLSGGVAAAAWLPALSLLLLGGAVAADLRLAPATVAAAAVVLGAAHGWLNGAAIAADGREASGLLGIASALFVVVALVSALTVSARAPWTRIAARVAGSWIAAIGLLLAGWSLRPG